MQTSVAGKSNEISSILERLRGLDLTGARVTIDAVGCQKTIAQQIIQAQADYGLALKGNHLQLYANVRLWLDIQTGIRFLDLYETIAKRHSSLEFRQYSLSNIAGLAQKPGC
jgi:predicted transposase YbfD/YdcC